MFWNKLKRNKKHASKCETCGEIHEDLPAIGFSAPWHYDGLSALEKQEIAQISDDVCIITYEDQTDRFIRTVLTIPVNDACGDLDYGIWVSVSEKTFNEYKSNFNNESGTKVYFGMICNEISGYDESTLNLHVNVETQDVASRPKITLHDSEHKLVQDCKDGINLSSIVKLRFRFQ